MINKTCKSSFFCILFVIIYIPFVFSQTVDDIKDFLNSGIKLYKNGKLDEALIEFENVLLLDPNNFEAQLWLAQIYIDKKQLSRARILLEKLSKHKPNHPKVNALISLINKPTSDNNQKSISNVSSRKSSSKDIIISSNLLHKNSAKKSKLGIVIPESNVKKKESISINLLDERKSLENNENKEELSAFNTFENILKPDDPIDEIILLMKQEGIKTALDRYFELIFSNPELISHNDRGLLKRGLDEFLPTLEKNPQNLEARYYVGVIFYLNGQVLDAYRTLLPLKENSSTYSDKIEKIFADIEIKKAQEEAILAKMQKNENSIDNSGKNGTNKNIQFTENDQQKNDEKIQNNISASSDISSESQQPENKDYTQEGYDLYKKGHLDKSIEYFNKAIQVKPNEAKAYYYLGLAYTDKALSGDVQSYDKALEAFSKVLQLEPADSKLAKDSDLMIKDIMQAKQLLSK